MNKKLLAKFKGPYRIKTVLPNDRYIVEDIEGFQNTQIPFTVIFDSTNLKLWPCIKNDMYKQKY